MAFGRDIGARHHLEEALGNGIADFLLKQLLGIDPRPRMLVVMRADAFVMFDRRHHAGALLAKCLNRRGGLGAVFFAHARHVVDELAVELDLLGIHRNGLQTEMLDQLAQRVRSGHRVIVDLGDAGFIHRRRAVEFARQDLAADAVGGLIDGDPAEIAELLLQIPGAHQAARTTTNNCKIKHLFLSRVAASNIRQRSM